MARGGERRVRVRERCLTRCVVDDEGGDAQEWCRHERELHPPPVEGDKDDEPHTSDAHEPRPNVKYSVVSRTGTAAPARPAQVRARAARLGGRLSERYREAAEKLAGLARIGLAILLLVAKLA